MSIQLINHAIEQILGRGPFDYDSYTQAEIEAVRILRRVRHYLLVRMIAEARG